jgi:hypothetical protein
MTMPITLEFGKPGGALHGIAAALSPQVDPGFMGGLRAFLNPEPVLKLEAEQRARLQWQQVWNRNGQNITTMTQGLQSGTPEGRQAAAQALATMTQDFTQAGFDPAPIIKTYEFMSSQSDIAGMRQIPPDPASRLSQAGRFVTDPNQVANLARTEVLNQMTGAQTLGQQQETQQAGALFPLKQQGMTLENVLRNAQIGTEGARQGLIGQQTGLAGSQQDIAQQRADILRRTGMLPGTAGGGPTGGRQALIHGTVDPNTGQPAIYDPNIDKYYPQSEKPEDVMMREALGANRPQQGLPPALAPLSAVPAQAGGGVPALPPAPGTGQAGTAAPTGQPAREFGLGDINKMSDEELGALMVNEKSLTDQQRQRLDQLRSALQAALAKTPDEAQRRKLLADMQRQYLSELFAGQ